MCVSTTFAEDGWADRGQGNILSLGWETIIEGEWTTSLPTAWRFGKETGILPDCNFPWKDLKFYIRKEEGKWTP